MNHQGPLITSTTPVGDTDRHQPAEAIYGTIPREWDDFRGEWAAGMPRLYLGIDRAMSLPSYSLVDVRDVKPGMFTEVRRVEPFTVEQVSIEPESEPLRGVPIKFRMDPFSRLYMYGPGRGLLWSLKHHGEEVGWGRSRTNAGADRAMKRLQQKTINRQKHKARTEIAP